jgi:hypothetical protein
LAAACRALTPSSTRSACVYTSCVPVSRPV